MGEKLRQKWEREFKEEIQILAKRLDLSPEISRALDAEFQTLVAEHMPRAAGAILAVLPEDMRARFGDFDSALTYSLIRSGNIPLLVAHTNILGTEAWEAVLNAHLSPEQQAKWDTEKQRRRKDAQNTWDGIEAQSREFASRAYAQKIHAIQFDLSLPEERTKQLRELVEKSIQTALEGTRELGLSYLSKLPESGRKNPRGGFLFFSWLDSARRPGDNRPLLEAAWEEGLKDLFSATELEQISQCSEVFVREITPPFVRLRLARIAHICGTTVDQLRKLEPLAVNALRKDPDPNVFEGGGRDSLTRLLALNTEEQNFTIPEKDLALVLSPSQLAMWREYSRKQNNPNQAQFAQKAPQQAQANPPEAAETDAPEDGEELISSHLWERSQRSLQSAREPLLAKIEQWSELLKLDPDSARSLRLAAKGATEAALRERRDTVERTLRMSLDRSPNVALPVRLKNSQNLTFSPLAPENEPIWKEAVERILTAEHKEKLQTLIRERDEYLSQAAHRVLVLIVAQELGLQRQQLEECEKRFTRAFEEYGPEMLSIFARSSTRGFRDKTLAGIGLGVATGYQLLCICGEEDVRKFLTPFQWERMKANHLWMNAENMFGNLKNLRAERLKKQNTQPSGGGANP